MNFLKGDMLHEMTNQEILNGDGGEWEILTEEELKKIMGGGVSGGLSDDLSVSGSDIGDALNNCAIRLGPGSSAQVSECIDSGGLTVCGVCKEAG